MAFTTPSPAVAQPMEALDRGWIGIGILLGAILLAPFILLADPFLIRPEVSGLAATLTLILVGAFIGYRSGGESSRETAVAGLGLGGLALIFLAVVLQRPLSAGVGLLAIVYAPALAMAGGWLGETLRSAGSRSARAVDWPWIVVGVFVGSMASLYAIFGVEALVGLTAFRVLVASGAGFVLAGIVVGLRVPGATILEPAIAALGVIALEGALVYLAFEALARVPIFVFGLVGGVALSILGGFIGELVQTARTERDPSQRVA